MDQTLRTPETSRDLDATTPIVAACLVAVATIWSKGASLADWGLIVVLFGASITANRGGWRAHASTLLVYACIGVWSQIATAIATTEPIAQALFWLTALGAPMIIVVVLRRFESGTRHRDYVFWAAIASFLCTHGFGR